MSHARLWSGNADNCTYFVPIGKGTNKRLIPINLLTQVLAMFRLHSGATLRIINPRHSCERRAACRTPDTINATAHGRDGLATLLSSHPSAGASPHATPARAHERDGRQVPSWRPLLGFGSPSADASRTRSRNCWYLAGSSGLGWSARAGHGRGLPSLPGFRDQQQPTVWP